MKKLLVLIVVLAMAIGGCATIKDAFCNNRVIIEKSIATAQNMITAIQTTFGNYIPPEYMAVITAANVVINLGNSYLDTVTCPTDAQVAQVQEQQAGMQTQAKMAAKMTLQRTK